MLHGGDTGIGAEDVDAAEGLLHFSNGGLHRGALPHIDGEGAAADLGRDFFRLGQVEIADGDPNALPGKCPGNGPADPRGCPRDDGAATGKLWVGDRGGQGRTLQQQEDAPL